MPKKLLPALPAGRTIACHPYLSVGNFETLLTANVVFHLLTHWALKLHNFTAAETDQVVMLSRGFYLVVVVRLVEVKFLN